MRGGQRKKKSNFGFRATSILYIELDIEKYIFHSGVVVGFLPFTFQAANIEPIEHCISYSQISKQNCNGCWKPFKKKKVETWLRFLCTICQIE